MLAIATSIRLRANAVASACPILPAAVNKRFGELGDYNVWAEATVYFGNGKVNVDPQYLPQLQALAQKAVTVNGYIIQLQGTPRRLARPH